MNKKRILSSALAAALTVTGVTAFEVSPSELTVYAAEEYKPGDEVKADFVYLRLLEDNTWEVFYSTKDQNPPQSYLTGEAIPKSYKKRPVTRIADNAFPNAYCYTLRAVEIPEGVTSIGKRAFSGGNMLLESVKIPSTVESIGSGAFYATRIKTIKLPDKLTRIEDNIFESCDQLTTVNIPSGVTYIGNKAFSHAGLKSVEFPPKLKTIGASAFESCGGLTYSTTFSKIPDTVEEIGSRAFSSCGLTDVVVPESVKSFGTNVFDHCRSLKTAVLPKHFTSIPNGTFNYCSSLTEFTIPDKVKTIGNSAFYNCESLKSMFIPKSVTSIGTEAFLSSGIKDIYYEGSEDDWDNVERGNNWANASVKVHYDCKKTASVPVEVVIHDPKLKISDVTVKVTGGNLKDKPLTLGADGTLSLEGLENGVEYTITFSAKNCAPHDYKVKVSNGTAMLPKIELNLLGDINGDGKLTLGDVLKANASARNSKPLTGYDKNIADINGDGKISLGDVLKMNAHARNSKLLW